MKEILINIESKEIRVALLKQKKLYDLTVERKKSRQITGNIYRGKVTNILKNIQSAFIDIGENENGFIHITDIVENTQKFQDMFDMEFDRKPSAKEEPDADISKFLKKGQSVLVQVVKEPIGTKGARLTSNTSIVYIASVRSKNKYPPLWSQIFLLVDLLISFSIANLLKIGNVSL